VIVLAACSGRAGAPAHPEPKPTGGSGSAATATTTGASDADCDKLITHAVDLGIAERPADQKPTADERTSLQAQLRQAWSAKCKQITSREYSCAIAAHTLAELDACGS
jgi:hypothetical protein